MLNAQGQLEVQVWLGIRRDLAFWGKVSWHSGERRATLHTICPLKFWEAIARQDPEYVVHTRFGPVATAGELQL